MTLAEVEALPGTELDRWKAYHAVEPIPRPGWFAAQIAAAVVNGNRTKGPPAKVEDFFPRVAARGRRRRPTGEQMIADFRAAVEGT